MLAQDLSLTSNSTGMTLPGSSGALTFGMVSGGTLGSQTLRRETTSALTQPKELVISHQSKGSGYKERQTTLVKYTYKDEEVDPSLTGGETPGFAITFTINRPKRSGGSITPALIKTGVGQLLSALLGSGNLDKLINGEA